MEPGGRSPRTWFSAASRARRLPPRTCLRKGCCRVYHPTRWNQRYCQQAECRRLVRRWQAAKRQQVHRRLPDNRRRHAEAEAICRRNRTTQPPAADLVAAKKWPVRAARGHAAKIFQANSATGRDAMNRCRTTRGPRSTTAAMIVGRPCDEFAIANGSGCHATDIKPYASAVRYLREQPRRRPKRNR